MPKTTRFRKLVLSPGKYYAGRTQSGEELYEDFSPERLMKVADQGNQFLASGAKIPVPYAHYDDTGNLVSPVNISDEGLLVDAFTDQPIGWRGDLNSGYVHGFSYGTFKDPETGKEYEGLISDLDIDGDADDISSHAAKFGKTVKETSLGVNRTARDKNGTVYEDLPIHVAAVMNPVDTEQPNFIKEEENELAAVFSKTIIKSGSKEDAEKLANRNVLVLSSNPFEKKKGEEGEEETGDEEADGDNLAEPKNPMLQDDPQTAPAEVQVAQVVEALREIGLDLPDDTNEETFMERMVVAIRQKISDQTKQETEPSEEALTAKPQGNEPTGAPIAMSTATTKPSQAEKMATILFSRVVADKRTSLKQRVQKLIASNRCTSEYAEKSLLPKVDAITLSSTKLDDLSEHGELPTSEVENIIDALEQTPGKDLTSADEHGGTPEGSSLDYPQYESLDDEERGEHSDEELVALSASVPV